MTGVDLSRLAYRRDELQCPNCPRWCLRLYVCTDGTPRCWQCARTWLTAFPGDRERRRPTEVTAADRETLRREG